jgi:hypothetical protein
MSSEAFLRIYPHCGHLRLFVPVDIISDMEEGWEQVLDYNAIQEINTMYFGGRNLSIKVGCTAKKM